MRICLTSAIAVLFAGLAPATVVALPFVDRGADVGVAQPFLHTAGVAAIKCRARNFPRLTVIENKVLAFKTGRPTGTRLPPNLAANRRSVQTRVARCVQREKWQAHRKRFKY